MHVCINLFNYVCMYVYMYVCICIHNKNTGFSGMLAYLMQMRQVAESCELYLLHLLVYYACIQTIGPRTHYK